MENLPWEWRSFVTLQEPEQNSLREKQFEWSARLPKIVANVICCNPDVVCLQEVDHWEEVLSAFKEHGFSGVYAKKKMDKPDAVAILYKQDIELLTKEQIYLEGAYGLEHGTRDQVALIAELRRGACHCLIAATHLKSDHKGDFEPVRLAQVMILLEKLQAINVANLPLIIAGDFNSSPSSSLYTLLHRKHVEAAVGDVNQKKRLKLKHTLWLDSAYLQHEQREPECTFKDISGWESTLDYIWYTPASLAPLQILGIPPSTEVPLHPNASEPSDHLPLCCEFGFLS